MTHAGHLPPVPTPPHDPRSLRLDQRAGWREGQLDEVEIAPDGSLALLPLPGAGPQLADPSGNLGGLAPPLGMAVSGDDVYAIDPAGKLSRFDRCTGRFDVLPCLPGVGGGISICRGNLFVADGVSLRVYLLRGLVLRGTWQPPATSWEPIDVAFDSRGFVYVADRAGSAVHVFAPTGTWIRAFGVGAAWRVAIDRFDRLYVVVDGDPFVRVMTLGGDEIERIRRADEVADRFCPLPEAGMPVAAASAVPEKRYPASGRYLSAALDSKLYQCRWDRVAVRAIVPRATRLRIRTYTAETELPIALIEALDDSAWQTDQIVADGDWDCLVLSGPGRFLWIAVELATSGFATPRIAEITVDFPRIPLTRHLPGIFAAEPRAGDFTDRFLAIFDRGFRQMEAHVDGQARLLDPCSSPTGDARRGESDFLGWLAGWVGVAFAAHWSEPQRRRYLKRVGRLFCTRGTRTGLRRHLLLFLGIDCFAEKPWWNAPELVLEHFQMRRWLFVDAGRLGDQSRLWGKRVASRSQLDENAQLDATQLKTWHDPRRDPFHAYAHRATAFLPAGRAPTEGARRAVRMLVELERPAHVQLDIRWVEPRMRVGVQSMIGYDAVVGGYPAPHIAVNESLLGRATVVARAPNQGNTMRVDDDARVGTTTRLG